ncbi:MAG: hypothetical protein JWM34_3763 [Ilumatobacteraceae bacterium]|nr:hypothetical protein [Ilumatobacteraceae bacterium]
MLGILRDLLERIDCSRHATVHLPDGSVLVSTDPDAQPMVTLSPASLALATGQPHRLFTLPDSPYAALCATRGVFSEAAFPVLENRTALAVLTVDSEEPYGFVTADLKIGITTAAQLAELVVTPAR